MTSRTSALLINWGEKEEEIQINKKFWEELTA
jgi:hypothetical protein